MKATVTIGRQGLIARAFTCAAVGAAFVLAGFSAQAQSVTAVKAYVKSDGFYRVSAIDIADMLGLTESEVAGMPLQVLNLGVEVASVRDAGDVVFYGTGYSGPYTDENVYWIVSGQPSALPVMNVSGGSSPYQLSFPSTKKLEQHLLIRADLVSDFEEDPILWRMLTSGLITKTYTVTMALDHVAPSTGGYLTVRLKGATDTSGRFYHRARIDLNGVTLGFIDFQGLESKEVTFPVSAGQWINGNNSVKVESTPPAGTMFDSFFIDYISADYQRTFNAASGLLDMPVESGSVQVTDLPSSDIRVWNVTDPLNIQALSGQQVVQNGGAWAVSMAVTEPVSLAVAANGYEKDPVRLGAVYDIGLKDTDWELDHLVICAEELLLPSIDLAYYRASMGLDAAVITIDDVYDAFNYGIRDARALDAFLKYIYRNWARYPRYVVLAGDGSLDNRNLLGYNDSLIPAFPLIGPNGLYASDYRYGDPTGTGQLEIAVGRIPVTTVQAMDDYIWKMINYEWGGDWRTNKLVSTDQNDYGGDFLGIGNQLSDLIEGNIFRGDLTTQALSEVRSAVIGGINQGREVTMYVGHGTPNQLSAQSILLLNDMPTLTNDVAPTAFVAIGCLIGSFNDPGKVNLGEGLVTAKGGAAAVLAAATLISAADGQVLSEAFLDQVYNEGSERMGDAWRTGKNQLTAAFRNPAFNAFQFLGDPAAAVGDPEAPAPAAAAPSIPGYEEWVATVLPPVLQDLGQTLDAEGDEDGDGNSNFTEYKAGTDPFDASSTHEVMRIKRPTSSTVQLSWPSTSGRTYSIEWSSQPNGPYTLLTNGVVSTSPINIENFVDPAQQMRFFRVGID